VKREFIVWLGFLPYNADSLRQTSFALVEVLPDIGENTDVEIKEDDLEWDFYRAGGHGGKTLIRFNGCQAQT